MFFIWCFCCRWHVIVSIDGDVCDDGYDDDDEDEDDYDDDDDHDDARCLLKMRTEAG